MRPMRVCMLSVHTCPLATLGGKETGGMNVYVRELTRELARRGVRVDVFTRLQDPSRRRVNDALGGTARVIHVKAGPPIPLDKRELYEYMPEFIAGVQEFADGEGAGYDMIHSHYWLSGVAAIALQQRWDVPFAQMYHTLGHMKNSVAQRPEELESELRLGVETDLMQRADALVAATPLEKAHLF